MKRYYCHECGKSFPASEGAESCDGCGSEFIELLETEEARTTGVSDPTASLTTPTSLPDPPRSSSATTSRPSPSPAAGATTRSASTTSTTTTTSRGPPINITIGSNPIFRGGMGVPFNHFASGGGGGVGRGRDSPMDTGDEDEDPGDEVLTIPQLRRRHAAQVRIGPGHVDPGMGGGFPGNVFMVSQSPRVGLGGFGRPSLAQMLHEHIANAMAERDAHEEADGRQQGTPEGQQQSGQQGQQGATPTEASSTRNEGGEGRGTGAPNREAPRRNNVRVINFPSVQVMMTRGQPGSSQGATAGAGNSASGGANPQVPQFGAPMFFGLPLGPLMGLHGSPSDYAWGPQGLENIISQMLANLEDDGPPPTQKEKLESLPCVEATDDALKECTLCSVCKDDFTVGESLVKLPCTHLYHKDCVFPWLEMHDTCPTCRFHLNTGKYEDERTT